MSIALARTDHRMRRHDQARFYAVVRGMLDRRSNAFVESMNGQLQQAKHAARGYRTTKNFIAIDYLRLSRLKNLPAHPFSAAAAVR